MDERGTSGHVDDPHESAAWLGDHAQDAWTDHDVDGDVVDDHGPVDDGPVDDGPVDDDPVDDEPGDDEPGDDEPGDVYQATGEDSDESQRAGRWWHYPALGVARWQENPPSETPRWQNPAFFAGALVGMLVIALIWLFAATGSDARPQDNTSNAAGPHHRSTAASPTPSLDERREKRCADTAAALHDALLAAGPALDQWEVHVGAMNKLVVGAITLQQATQFWNQTRIGAHQRLVRFRATDRSLSDRAKSCPSPQTLADAPAALRSCARVVARDRETLAVARTAIDTWSHHVHDMEMLRMGHMSAASATRMWLASWKQGVRELEAYRSAVRAQHQQRCLA